MGTPRKFEICFSFTSHTQRRMFTLSRNTYYIARAHRTNRTTHRDPYSMLTSCTSNTPTRDRLDPHKRRTTCLQMRRRSKPASRRLRRCTHDEYCSPNHRGSSVHARGRSRWSKFGSGKPSSRTCDNCRPAASREGFHGRRGVAVTVGSTCSRAASIAREPRKGSPRAAILRHSYHLRCENRSQPENQG